jgi:hypothetical protein
MANSYHFHHIAVYYDWLYTNNVTHLQTDVICFLGDNYFHLSAVDQYIEEVERLASSLHRPSKGTADDSIAA